MENSYKFFKNTDCKYYPCHNMSEDMNCLFCYCPLYDMDNCPGEYTIIEKDGRSIKSCMDCVFPHVPGNYEEIIKILAGK